jgi:ribosome-binding protein aMBF1 (putative translation factor)
VSRKSSGPAARTPERRRNPTLREVLDELVAHVRDIARRARGMSQEELDYAQQRLEWLADEVWRLAVRGEDEPPR